MTQLMHKNFVAWKIGLSQLNQMLMVCEKNHLSLLRKTDQLLECLDRPLIVEMDQDIIDNQWDRFVHGIPLLEARQTER
jgi:hypothetical protein